MDFIRKTICIRDFESRDIASACTPYLSETGYTNCDTYLDSSEVIDGNPCSNYFGADNDRFFNQRNWGYLTGLTESGDVEYYYGSDLVYESNLLTFNLLITNTIDDIGWKESVSETPFYNYGNYELPNGDILIETGNTVSFIGDSRIDEFRRATKGVNDLDLYNSNNNTGFTYQIPQSNGNINKIIAERVNTNASVKKQNLYDYVIGFEDGDIANTGIHFSDIDELKSNITYKTQGFDENNSVKMTLIKKDHLMGVAFKPKINSNVNIDRGVNSVFDKHLNLGEIRSLDALTRYGNGVIQIIEN